MSVFFSIVIPTYNRAHMLSKAIDSVLSQTFSDWELIIVNDGSTDNTENVVKQYSDPRIFYVFQKNVERSAARNNGIQHAKGKYICFLDSDDYYLPQRLAKLYEGIVAHAYPIALIYTGICFEYDNNIIEKPELTVDKTNIYDFIVQAFIGTPQVCIEQSILEKHKFNTRFHIGEDMELWLRIVSEYPIIYFQDQHTIVALAHDERSVNEQSTNNYAQVFKMLKFAFAPTHPGSQTSLQAKKKILSNVAFGQAKYYMYTDKTLDAIYWICRSLVYDLISPQSSHKLYCMASLLPILNLFFKKQYLKK